MKKALMVSLKAVLSMIYVAAVYYISMSTPILSKINYNGRQYIEYSLKSFIFFGAAVGIYVFAHGAIKQFVTARAEKNDRISNHC